MSIRIKLLLSYIVMLVIPVVLTIAAAIAIFVVYADKLESTAINEYSISKLEEIWHKDIQQAIAKEPDKFKDIGYLRELDNKLGETKSSLIVFNKSKVLIYSSEGLNRNNVIKKIESFDSNIARANPFIERNMFVTFNREFKFIDNTEAYIFVVTDVGPLGQFAKKYISTLVLAIIGILILTNGTLTYLVSRGIIKPLKVLKHGAEQIKEGNLDFKVKVTSRDEFGQVCLAFEEMRSKLKESIDTQLQYEENRKELISSISHDLKTPITAIKGYVEGIMDGVADSPEKMNKYIKTIYAKAIDMDKMIDDLFLFSKLDLKKLPFNFEKIGIKDYFDDCIEELRIDLDEKQIQMNYDIDFNEEITVLIDREKLKRVIINIVENSVKYMQKDNGKISIRLNNRDNEVLVQIEDNGQGIKNEELPYIFDRFYRADPSRNTAKGGSGLGLAIAKQIIEGHGGEIWVESEYGEGTSMFFTLKKYIEC
ncbi:MAG: HAMP domain-containing histidine kinase [Clostridia bacterium]|nr:HAMP domain-containing histidine kinase [Clostridia bacterium]